MKRISMILAGGSVALAACTPAPASLTDEPERISRVDYFILRASQAGTAEILAERCPRYRFDQRKENQLKARVIAAVEGDGSLPEAADFMRELVPKARRETQRYALEYQRRNNLTEAATAEDFCRVADEEVARQSIIGQLLRR